MVGKSNTASVYGIMTERIEVEADVTSGIPSFDMTGNLGGTAKEAKERVRTALRNSGIKLSPARITINLSPAHIRKEGPHYDLAIAIAILCSTGLLDPVHCENMFFAGELGLDGGINKVNGILPIVICAREYGATHCLVPKDNEQEAAFVRGIQIIGVGTLGEAVSYLRGDRRIEAAKSDFSLLRDTYEEDFKDLCGQMNLKRGLILGAAARHNTLIIGPPGEGKTMAARRIPSILPDMTFEESLMISQIYSVAGLLHKDHAFVTTRPFRCPHHTITPSAFIGGGSNPMPGEMSLAGHGVLYLDEINLFTRQTIETLREPMESRKIVINRQRGTCEYPAEFLLVASMNPCKCGFYPDKSKCNCTEVQIKEYFGKLSRPFLDRLDLCIQVNRIGLEEMELPKDHLTSQYMKEKVIQIQQIQQDRYKGCEFSFNSQIPPGLLQRYCVMDQEAKTFVKKIFEKYELSARSYHKLMKVARTIGDMEASEIIRLQHISEAFGYKLI